MDESRNTLILETNKWPQSIKSGNSAHASRGFQGEKKEKHKKNQESSNVTGGARPLDTFTQRSLNDQQQLLDIITLHNTSPSAQLVNEEQSAILDLNGSILSYKSLDSDPGHFLATGDHHPTQQHHLVNGTSNILTTNQSPENQSMESLKNRTMDQNKQEVISFEVTSHNEPESDFITEPTVAIAGHATSNNVSKNSTHGDNDPEDTMQCGWCSLNPPVLQSLANKKCFLIIFCLTSILQGMYSTYFVSILTTIEKLYQIQSKTIGVIMSATEISQIIGSLLLTYYAGHGHRPKWISIGILIFAASSILTSTPHFLFPNHRQNSGPSTFMSSSSSKDDILTNRDDSGPLEFSKRKLCLNYDTSSTMTNETISPSCQDAEEVQSQSETTSIVLIMFFLSRFFVGVGTTAVNTLGIPYIDDNVAPKESPLYFGITIGTRIFGPVFGFVLGSICTSIYVDFPFGSSLGLSTSDAEWVGAWWLGSLVIGISLVIISIPMMAFPRRLPSPDPDSYCHKQMNNRKDATSVPEMANGQKTRLLNEPITVEWKGINGHHDDEEHLKQLNYKSNSNNNVNKVMSKDTCSISNDGQSSSHGNPTLKNFPVALKRLVKNEILMYRIASSVLHILPIAGLYSFLPKYLESQFYLTASSASMVSGLAGILIMGLGIFASGIFMRKFNPGVSFVAAWIAATALLYAIGMVILMSFGCSDNSQIIGLNVKDMLSPPPAIGHRVDPGGVKPWVKDSSGFPPETCSAACSCPKGEFAPICTSSGTTYISPCLAGCSQLTANATNSNNVIYSDCKCLETGSTAMNGQCDLNCGSALVWYIVIFSFFVLIHSTSEVGAMLLTLRSVDPQDKAMALGLIAFATGLFGNLPCSIIYGAVVDSSCLFWELNCDTIGACRVYDSLSFRLSFHGLTAVIMLLAFIVDVIVWFKSGRIKLSEATSSPDVIVPLADNVVINGHEENGTSGLKSRCSGDTVDPDLKNDSR